MLPINFDISLSYSVSSLSIKTKMMSNLDTRAGGKSKFFISDNFLFYLPYSGLAAAKMAVLAFN